MKEYQIFISYRRDGGESLAALLCERFTRMGYCVFCDQESLRNGKFNEKLLEIIEQCQDVLLVLPPDGLKRCVEDENDQVRREIGYALSCRKNVIPVMMRNFVYPDNLPDDLKILPELNGISANMEFFDAVVERIADKLLICQPKERMSGKPTPYRGSDPYIFISYAHKNSNLVWPIIEQMQKEGYRVWYDEGIDPGTEWDENIAKHVHDCGYFIAFLSEEYIASDNCMDEVNFARDLNKDRLLIYLSDVQLPLGMAMRLNRLQAIHWYTYDKTADFYRKLAESKGISRFKTVEKAAVETGVSEEVLAETSVSEEVAAKTGGSEKVAGAIKEVEEQIALKMAEKKANESSRIQSKDFVIKDGILMEYRGSDEHIIIPENVTALGEGCFKNCRNVTSVVIPEGVTEIGKEAFKFCSNLEQIIIPESMTKIGEYAFAFCDKLKEASLPDHSMEIGGSAFSFTDLREFVWPSGTKMIATGMFLACKNLRSIQLPDTVTEMGTGVFTKTALVSVTLPSGLKRIPFRTFEDCGLLQDVYLSDSVEWIASDAFKGCPKSMKIHASALVPQSLREQLKKRKLKVVS